MTLKEAKEIWTITDKRNQNKSNKQLNLIDINKKINQFHKSTSICWHKSQNPLLRSPPQN